MKPTRVQYFLAVFAQGWVWNTWVTVGTLLCVVFVIKNCEPTAVLLHDWKTVLWLIATAFLALPVGFLLTLIAGSCFLGTLYDYCSLKNGAPFRPGDRVRILSGPHKDTITSVYEVLQGNSVRVELGQKEKDESKDIFRSAQLFRE